MNTILIRIVKGAIISVIAGKIVDVASDKFVEVANKAKNKINESEKIKEIKKDLKLRRQGVTTVKYQNIDK